jgi:hypothetical protein
LQPLLRQALRRLSPKRLRWLASSDVTEESKGAHPYEDEREKWRFWSRALTRAPIDLREHLNVDETGFRMVAGPAHANARDYFVYGALDEVQQAGVAILGWDEFLEGPIPEDEDAVTRMVLERTIEEQSFWSRKLLEALIDLIGFTSTNEEAYYRHFLLLRELRDFLATKKDLIDFYACPSENVEWSINRTYNDLVKIEQSGDIDLVQAWYVSRNQPLASVPTSPAAVFNSVRQRLKVALTIADDHEKLVLGLSYDRAYGTVSKDIHFRPAASLRPVSGDEIAAGIDRIALIGLSAIVRVQKLLDCQPEGINKQLAEIYETNEYPRKVYNAMTAGRASVGDFVVAYGDLAEVLAVSRSEFGYESYHVRYLSERPLPDVEEDWHPAQHVRRLYSADEMLRRLKTEDVPKGRFPPEAIDVIERASPEAKQQAIREGIVTLWEQGGLRDYVQAQLAKMPSERVSDGDNGGATS